MMDVVILPDAGFGMEHFLFENAGRLRRRARLAPCASPAKHFMFRGTRERCGSYKLLSERRGALPGDSSQ